MQHITMRVAGMAIGALLLFTSSSIAAPKYHTSCALENHPYVVAHYDSNMNKLNEEEHEDWRVTCTIKADKKLIYEQELALARPTEFRDAMIATEKFRKEDAPRIIDDWRHNGSKPTTPQAEVPHIESGVQKP